jgi:uncharacterized protein
MGGIHDREASGLHDNAESPKVAEELLERLIEELQPCGRLAVAFSGGVDSSVVVAVAARSLGVANVLAVTAKSETLPERELVAALELAKALGVPHAVIETRELDDDEFCANPRDRCYHCKTELWRRLNELVSEKGIINIADGVNADDDRDYRPGIRASDEAGVLHPLAAVGAGKAEVRAMAQALGLANWDKPAQACLSSRFPYGEKITSAGLRRVEQAEEVLRALGIRELRVRSHGDIARIEVPAALLAELSRNGRREEIVMRLKEVGFRYVTLDLEGFRSGSMNEVWR